MPVYPFMNKSGIIHITIYVENTIIKSCNSKTRSWQLKSHSIGKTFGLLIKIGRISHPVRYLYTRSKIQFYIPQGTQIPSYYSKLIKTMETEIESQRIKKGKRQRKEGKGQLSTQSNIDSGFSMQPLNAFNHSAPTAPEYKKYNAVIRTLALIINCRRS